MTDCTCMAASRPREVEKLTVAVCWDGIPAFCNRRTISLAFMSVSSPQGGATINTVPAGMFAGGVTCVNTPGVTGGGGIFKPFGKPAISATDNSGAVWWCFFHCTTPVTITPTTTTNLLKLKMVRNRVTTRSDTSSDRTSAAQSTNPTGSADEPAPPNGRADRHHAHDQCIGRRLGNR